MRSVTGGLDRIGAVFDDGSEPSRSLCSLDVMAAPDIATARRAAAQLIDAGAGRVLVFGSVARGEATEDSDIDLVAIFDDLGDYSTRANRRCALEAKARKATGCPVDVMVTDAPEWAVRTTEVPCSVEARVAGDAVELADIGSHAGIYWDKEIGLPADPTAELESRFSDMSRALLRLKRHLSPDQFEHDAADDGDAASLELHEGERFASAMTEILAVIECAAKVTHVVSVGTAPAHKHEIPLLLGPQPDSVEDAFWSLAGDRADLAGLHRWRPGVTYVDSRPDLPTEDQLRDHCDAALDIAAFATDLCRQRDISADQLNTWEQHVQALEDALDGAIRHRNAPGLGLER
ncbi:nucleotidyltransferase domain-containing protein [Candidatus Poriferisodalis sp.]|uniref:nucleotidyltransferase domain-containing protein n=1 Tax=Candidatus Poriferisodalis sp. TaxID=3101277 RepID=UPI003B0165E6